MTNDLWTCILVARILQSHTMGCRNSQLLMVRNFIETDKGNVVEINCPALQGDEPRSGAAIMAVLCSMRGRNDPFVCHADDVWA